MKSRAKVDRSGPTLATNSILVGEARREGSTIGQGREGGRRTGRVQGSVRGGVVRAADRRFVVGCVQQGQRHRHRTVLNAGMQIATSGFHTYNHNLIVGMRVLF